MYKLEFCVVQKVFLDALTDSAPSNTPWHPDYASLNTVLLGISSKNLLVSVEIMPENAVREGQNR